MFCGAANGYSKTREPQQNVAVARLIRARYGPAKAGHYRFGYGPAKAGHYDAVTVRLKPDTTERVVRLKPDTTMPSRSG